ncbi:facilitated trehalose transporter Tret1-like isoform X1 [Neodiprion fabricii]|uniref:facilitated trehalose transporter Tret1-like isoform X1 n=1 Tax=Neodiprion fabricii TaxID=2872261 RepID=UPI001ED93DEC|nr:facilitated trehalose transporter Tret1-like isoform X1 [Neodiprion fabricii]
MSSSQRRQMLQPWPVCLMFSNSKDRSILPKQYTKVPTIARSATNDSNIVYDCASNSTLATNASPFNSQLTLSVDKKGKKPGVGNYYADNLLSNHNGLKKSETYDLPTKGCGKDEEGEYKLQLDPLLQYHQHQIQSDTEKMFHSQEFQVKMTAGPPFKTYFQAEVPAKGHRTRYLAQVIAALSVSLGSMVVGFSSSYTSPALESMKNDTTLGVTEGVGSWIGSVMPLSALFGGMAGGPMIEYLGRRNTILTTGLPFIGSYLLIALAINVEMILCGRVLGGFCVGIASLALPVYLGETIQPEVRGSLGLMPTALGNIGILLCYVSGMYLDWSDLAILGALLPVPFIVLMFVIPETPRWHIARGNKENARKSLQWLRGKKTDVSEELSAIEKAHAESERNASRGAFRELFKKSYTKPLLISLGLMAFQQLSGINAVIFYTVTIFKDAGSTIDENVCTIIVGVVNFLSTFMATVLIDRLGRKILLYISSISMIVTLFTLGVFFYVKHLKIDVTAVGWLPLTSFVIYVIGFSLGFGPIPWLMMGEILPAKIRGSAASVVTAFNWTCTFIVTKTFNDIIALIGAYGTFWLFGLITLMGLIFVFVFVPETRGRSLEEIEMRLTGPVRRMSAVANIKPLPTAC